MTHAEQVGGAGRPTRGKTMKISNSKKQLAQIIHENGGWRDGEFAAQDGDGGVGGYGVKPEWNSQAKYWWREALDEWFSVNKINNHHQTVLSRAEYFHLYPAPNADGWIEWNGGECPVDGNEIIDIRYPESREEFGAKAKFRRWNHARNKGDIIAYRPHKPKPSEQMRQALAEANAMGKPTIEQLAADYRNAKDYADRKQQEADAAKADAEAKLAKLVAAGKALGLALSVTEPEPELVITDWWELQIGDVIECVSVCLEDNGAEMFDEDKRHHGKVCSVIGFEVGGVNHINTDIDGGLYIQDFKFIRRPAKGGANA